MAFEHWRTCSRRRVPKWCVSSAVAVRCVRRSLCRAQRAEHIVEGGVDRHGYHVRADLALTPEMFQIYTAASDDRVTLHHYMVRGRQRLGGC
jgi:hypothetical protein